MCDFSEILYGPMGPYDADKDTVWADVALEIQAAGAESATCRKGALHRMLAKLTGSVMRMLYSSFVLRDGLMLFHEN